MSRVAKLLFALCIVALALGGVIILTPTETAHACLPCNCPVENPPANCYGEYTLFLHRQPNGTFDMEFLTLDGRLILYLKGSDLARIPNPREYVLVGSGKIFPLNVFKLANGNYHINAGPGNEAKVFTVVIDGQNGARLEEFDRPAEKK
jgi:hypothetical protein